jgi:hypothetical protein
MKSNKTPSTHMQKVRNEIGYNYITINITQSRINKGFLSIPVSLLDRFPKESCVEYFDNDGWLRKVKFNDEEFNVYQAIDNFRDKYFVKDVHL